MKNTISLFLALLLFASCNKQNTIDNPPNSDPLLKSAIVEKNNSFSIDIFKELINNEDTEKNIFISPLSMYYALSMAGTGAANETRAEFVKLLGWENKTENEILKSMKGLYNDLMPHQSGISFEIANSLWQKQGAAIKESYKNLAREYFDAEVRELDFASPEAVDVINSWIEVKTNNKIKDMLDIIPPDAFMYLINAVYFKANWKYQFEEDNNIEDIFTQTNGTAGDVTYMRQNTNLQYLSNSLFTSVKLPYTDSNYYMAVFVPNQNIGVNELTAAITANKWKEWNNEYTIREVTVTLPKFKYSFGTRNINKELKSLGLVKAYSNEADFSNITDIQIYINRVLHKAFIEVNESGSEAAAATIVEVNYISADEPLYYINANKPFVFAICHEPTNSILFIGRVAYPEQ